MREGLIILFWLFLNYVAQASIELVILLSQPPNIEITGVHHYV